MRPFFMNSSHPVSPLTKPPVPNEKENAQRDVSIWGGGRIFGAVLLLIIILAPFLFHLSLGSYAFSLVTFLEVVVLFNILIIVHELGHFLAAKWCGLQIDKFAIWFGKPLWSRKINGVEYILGSIPAGGYVALPQMAPMETIEGKTETKAENLPPASPGKKIIVAFAGPLFSFGLAFVIAILVWIVGRPVTSMEQTTTIGYAYPDGPAYKAGLRDGDVIRSIDGHKVRRWLGVPDGVTWCIVTSTKDTLPIVVDRDGKNLSFMVTPEADPDNKHPHWWQRSVPPKIMIAGAVKNIIVGKVSPNSPASYAGLAPGQRLVALDGAPLLSPGPIYEAIKEHPYAPLHLTVSSGGATWPITVQPVKPISPATMPADLPPTDIGLELNDDADMIIAHPDPWLQVTEAANTVRGTLAALFTKHSKVNASQLSGPIGIMNIFFSVLSTENGWRIALWFAVVINVNLAMLNLLPFPILDGGHILLSVIEWVRRRPLSMSILEPLQTVCALFLIGYMLYVTFFDAQDSGKIAMNLGDTEVKFAPQTPP
jgi:regulator of sigma E protease